MKPRNRPADPRKGTANLQRRYATALALYQSGRLVQAEAALTEMLALQPQHADALHLLGTMKLQQGAFEDSRILFCRTIELKPDSSQAHQDLGEVLGTLGRLEEAEASLRRAVELKPDYGRAFSNLGGVLSRLGRRDEAVTVLQRALKLQPADVASHRRLGEALRLLNRPDEAESALRRAIALEPRDAGLHFDLGVLLQERGQAQDAAACYLAALRIDSAHGAARNNLALALPFVADLRKELERVRGAIIEKPGDADARRKLGMALWACGEIDEARTVLEEARALEPRSPAVHCGLALAAKGRGELDEALLCVRQAMALDPNDVYAQAAEASIVAALVGYPRGPRVALHMNQHYHYRILRPVFDALRDRHPALLTPYVKELVDFDPEIVVVAESHAGLLRSKLPRARFVWVRHGLISKNATCFAARSADFACLTSETSRDWYVTQGGTPRCAFWITGYPQMDPLFRDVELPIPLSLPAEHKKILYAPTWNAGLSSAPMLGERVVELTRGARRDVSLLIKPHPATGHHHPGWLAIWKSLAAADPHVHLVDDPAADVMPFLKAADVLVSDASSVIFEYLALDRPIVLVTNPHRHRAPTFDPNGIEWRWRDVGVEVHDVKELPAAVSAALDNPASGAERRAHYREQLFGRYTDGHAAERIAANITELGL